MMLIYREIKIKFFFPDTAWILVNISEVGEDQAVVGEVSAGLRYPGPALTAGLVLDYYITEDYKCRLC